MERESVYDGVGDTSDHRLFEFDSNDADGPSIWGDQTGNLGNLILKSNDDVHVYLEQTNPAGTVGEFRIYNGAGTLVYQVTEGGNTWAAGTKAALVNTEEYGERTLYAMESPEVWFEDFGAAQLANGQATVTIEPLFLQTINTEVSYHVFVTPLGDCNGLYVTNKTATSFEVRELGGGTANIEFDYRIVAKRRGWAHQLGQLCHQRHCGPGGHRLDRQRQLWSGGRLLVWHDRAVQHLPPARAAGCPIVEETIAAQVTVGRSLPTLPSATERSVKLSLHSALEQPGYCHWHYWR